MTRQTKTARQRAEEALGVAQRKVARLEREKGKYAKALHDVEDELATARKRYDYLAADPDLSQTGMDVPEPLAN